MKTFVILISLFTASIFAQQSESKFDAEIVELEARVQTLRDLCIKTI